jgi:hypothetical protein
MDDSTKPGTTEVLRVFDIQNGSVYVTRKDADAAPLGEGAILGDGDLISMSAGASCTVGLVRECFEIQGDGVAKVQSNFGPCLSMAKNCCDGPGRHEVQTQAGVLKIAIALR